MSVLAGELEFVDTKKSRLLLLYGGAWCLLFADLRVASELGQPPLLNKIGLAFCW